MRRQPDATDELRRRAEARLRARAAGPDRRDDELRRAVHELEVHQIELELRNEELAASRREAEAAASRSADLFEFAPAPYVSTDPDGAVREINSAAVALLGEPRPALVGRRLAHLVVPGDRARLDRLLADALVDPGGRPSCDVVLALPDGRTVPVRLTAARLPGAAEALVAVEDLSPHRRADALAAANAHLELTDRRKDEFLAVLSHELRNPLAAIRSALAVLDGARAGGGPPPRAKEIAHRQVAHLTRLVDDLLDVTRVAHGKIALRRAPLDLAAVACRAADDHRGMAQERGVALHVETPAEAVPVRGDETRLAQVVGNLLSNACKFTPAGGRVTLSVRVAGDEAVVSVRDTGAGIPPDLLEHIFDPFVQAEQTLARSEGGLGLGLALVKGLVELHGGAVGARSEGPGRGAELAFSLPLERGRPPAGAAAPDAPVEPPARRRVLVVDDNRDAADSLAELVQLLGHEVAVAYDGAAALAQSHAAPPDLVLCDLGLDGMDGYEIARRLRSGEANRAHLVAVSGYARPQDVARAVEAGFDDHVAKPIDVERLATLLA